MVKHDLQRIVVLCIVISSVILAGIWLANLGAERGQTQINPPALDLEPAPNETETSDVPEFEPGDTLPPTTENPTEPLPDPEPVACTMDAKMCPDGSFVGRTGPNCEFAACSNEAEVTVCTEAMRSQQFCTREYAPVCGLVEVQCVTTPCDPVPETFSNGCTACAQGNVSSYTSGSCEG